MESENAAMDRWLKTLLKQKEHRQLFLRELEALDWDDLRVLLYEAIKVIAALECSITNNQPPIKIKK